MSEFLKWYNKIPAITKIWLSLTIGLSVFISTLNLLVSHEEFPIFHYRYYVLDYKSVTADFQLWRPFTAIFYYPIYSRTSLHFLMNCCYLYSYSMSMEEYVMKGSKAKYFLFLIFCWACSLIVGLLVQFVVLMDCIVMSVVYVWCQLNKNSTVTFFYFPRFNAVFLPWVLAGFNMVISGGGIMEPTGMAIGHLASKIFF